MMDTICDFFLHLLMLQWLAIAEKDRLLLSPHSFHIQEFARNLAILLACTPPEEVLQKHQLQMHEPDAKIHFQHPVQLRPLAMNYISPDSTPQEDKLQALLATSLHWQ